MSMRQVIRLRSALAAVLMAPLLTSCGLAASEPQLATATPRPLIAGVRASEKWIEVDIPAQMVRLWIGAELQAEVAAATGIENRTLPGEYRVQQMIKGPIENVPGVWVGDIVIYDLFGGMGIHSRPMDAEGEFLDATLGVPASWGCVRVGESARVFDFAALGQRVWIH